MKYVLKGNEIFAVHDDAQEVESLYPGMEVWQTEELHELGETVTVRYSAADYDRALESHLLAERKLRGYTTREPDYYLNSSVPRWKQDAADWIAHRDAVMLYGLQVLNDYETGNPVPTLAEFKAALPNIVWSYAEE